MLNNSHRLYSLLHIYFFFLQEEEIAFLKKEIEFLRQNITINDSKINSISEDEYIKLEQENIKLKHRVAILKRVCIIKLI